MQPENSESEATKPERNTDWPRVYVSVFVWLAVMCLLMYYFTRATQ